MHPALRARLPDCQTALTALLSDAQEGVQDCASRGLSALHARGDAATRAALVEQLVGTLAGGEAGKRAAAAARAAFKVQAETELFEKGALGEAPSSDKPAAGGGGGGGAMSTYSELCAMATDLGQPDLVYRFMDLAAHARALAASKGAAHGMASIARRARAAMAPHLAGLVPRLFRMLHDPGRQTAEAAAAIWAAALPEPRAALEEHLDAIITDCLRELGGRLWRGREAAAGALTELLPQRRWPQLAPHFAQLWTMAMRGMDDIKESVRVAATALARALAAATLRLVEVAPPATPAALADAGAALDAALPLLLQQGVAAGSAEVRALAVRTLAALADKAPPAALQTHLPQLVGCLLESLSGMEDSRLSYIAQHSERVGIDGEALDAARLQASKAGALGEALDRCLKQCLAEGGDPGLDGVVARLAALARAGTGLATRAGAARFATSLLQRSAAGGGGGLGGARAGTLLAAFSSQLETETSQQVRAAYAAAAAAAARQAPEPRVRALVLGCAQAACAEPGGPAAQRAGSLLRALSKEAPERLSPYAAEVLPAAFLAKQAVAGGSAWGEVWESNTGAERAVRYKCVPRAVLTPLRRCGCTRRRSRRAPLPRWAPAAGRRSARAPPPPQRLRPAWRPPRLARRRSPSWPPPRPLCSLRCWRHCPAGCGKARSPSWSRPARWRARRPPPRHRRRRSWWPRLWPGRRGARPPTAPRR